MSKKTKLLGICLMMGLCFTRCGMKASAYTTDSITEWESFVDYANPTISIDMEQPIVGDNNLDQIEGLPSSTSFYKPIDINVSGVKSYYISTFLDCSSLSDTDKTKCETGNLLTSSGETLSSVSSAKTFGTMNNEWGFRYNLSDSVMDPKDKYFAALPTNRDNGYLLYNGAEQIKTSTTTYSDSKILTLGFGARIDGDIVAGIYNGKVTVAVVAVPGDVIQISSLTYLQQMTPEICNGTWLGQEYTLKDVRDGRSYKVAKLADDNCWMIQNLALDSGETEATRRQISSSSSDLASGTTYVLPVSKANTFEANSGVYMYNGTHQDGVYDNASDNTGAYYSWLTATTKTSNTAGSGNSSYSICPKGWKLPSGKDDGQFAILYNSYSASDNKTKREIFDEAWHPGYAGEYNEKVLNSLGVNGYWWSTTLNTDMNSFALAASVNQEQEPASSGNGHRRGFSVRCVAR